MTMIEMIPESVGWTIVGVLATICCLLIFQVGRTLIKMWKYHHEVDEGDVDETQNKGG